MYGPWVRVPAGSRTLFQTSSIPCKINICRGFLFKVPSESPTFRRFLVHRFVTKNSNLSPKSKTMNISLNFYLNALKTNARNQIPVYVRIRANGQKAEGKLYNAEVTEKE